MNLRKPLSGTFLSTALLSAILSTITVALVGSFALADDTSSGCGLGWEVSKQQTIVSSSVRATTNAILPNTFSMTSGTSGCAKHALVKNDERAVLFAVENLDSLNVEMAEGQGEFLKGFAQALGCSDSSFERFSHLTQSKYPALSAEGFDRGVGLYRAVRLELMNDALLALDCIPQG